MSGGVNVSGAWKNATKVSVKVGGAWKTASSAFIKVGGVWKQWLFSAITDAFNRTTSGSLGTADTGETWSALKGVWYANGTKAQSDSSASTYALASVSLGAQDVSVSADITDGGPGVAFWVTDANSWWASSVDYSSSYTPGATTCSGGGTFNGSIGCGGISLYWYSSYVTVPGSCPSGCLASYYAGNGTVYCYVPETYADCGAYGPSQSCTGPGGFVGSNGCGSNSYYYNSSYVTGPGYTTYTTTLKIYSSVSGSVSAVSSAALNSNTSSYSKVNSILATTSGDVITVKGYSSAGLSSQLGSTLTYTASSPTKGTSQGIIKTPSTDQQGSLVDNFSASL